MKITRKGFYTVEGPNGPLTKPDGSLRRVTSRDEAYEWITEEGPGTYTIKCPDREVEVVGLVLVAPPAASSVWTATVSEDDDFDLPGAVQFSRSHYVISSPASVEVHVERAEGANGAVSFTVGTFNITGDAAMTAGTNYTAVSQVVNFADREVGVKAVTIPINSVPTIGFHMIGLEITGASVGLRVKTPEAYIVVDDGGVNPGATIITTSTGNVGDIANAVIDHDAVTAAPGNIVVGDIAGTIEAAAAGDIIYLRGNAGDYYDNRRPTGEDFSGVMIGSSNGTRTAPIQVMAYPGETPVLNQQFSVNDDGFGHRYVGGISHYGASNPGYIHYRGLTITETVSSGIMFINDTSLNGMVIYGCHVYNMRGSNDANSSSDNIGCIRLDEATGTIIANCHLHNTYDIRSGSSNPFDSVPYALHSGIHGYAMKESWIEHNKIHNISRGIYAKRHPADLSDSHNIHNNLIYNFDEVGLWSGLAGAGGDGGQNVSLFRNAIVGDKTLDAEISGTRQSYTGPGTQPDGFFMYQNTVIDVDHLYYNETVIGIHAYSNILTDTTYMFAIEGNGGTFDNLLVYSDYNNWHNMVIGEVILNRSTPGVSTHSLAAFQALDQSTEATLANTPDMEVNATETAPVFTDTSDPDPSNNDYTNTNLLTSGYAGRPRGIGSEVVGEEGIAA